jgi:hypothetical protein
MNKSEECRANARECVRMASEAINILDKRKWLEMAASWVRKITQLDSPASDEFDATEALRGTGQDKSNLLH